MSEVGRPSGYNPEYHPQKLLELMSLGFTNVEICAEFDISPNTLLRWRKAHTEFNEAYEKGLPKCEAYLIINPLKEMVREGHDKGYKALAHLARNKFDHDKQSPQTVNNTQINVGQISVTNKEEFDKLASDIKEQLTDLNIIDVEFLELKPNDPE